MLKNPMSKPNRLKIDLLISAYDTNPDDKSTAKELIKALRTALETSEADRITLEKDIRTLEIALSKIDCTPRKV